MTTLVYHGSQRFELVDADPSAPEADEVVLDVIAAGICGSDIHGYAGLNDRRPPGTIMGHEVVGHVGSVGVGVGLRRGDVVAVWPIVACGECDLCADDRPHLCRRRRLFGCTPELPGGFATRMAVPARNLVPLPTTVPPEWGALAEPLAVGEHAVSLAEDRLDDRAVVIGGGPIGIAVALAARGRGVQEITIVEPQEQRRSTLGRLGFDAVAPGDGPRDLETVFECVGYTSTVRAAVEATRPGGTVVCVGVAEPELSIPMVALVIEERRLLGSSAYTYGDFVAVAESMARDDADLEPLIEARTDLAGTPEAFAEYAAGRASAMKTLVFPHGTTPLAED